jgi:hypothetical protein
MTGRSYGGHRAATVRGRYGFRRDDVGLLFGSTGGEAESFGHLALTRPE